MLTNTRTLSKIPCSTGGKVNADGIIISLPPFIRMLFSDGFELHKSEHFDVLIRKKASSEQAGFLPFVTRGSAHLRGNHTTLQSKALSFTCYPGELGQEDMTQSLLFIYSTLFFFLSLSSVEPVCTLPDTQYLDP